jgi:hypothetical protein
VSAVTVLCLLLDFGHWVVLNNTGFLARKSRHIDWLIREAAEMKLHLTLAHHNTVSDLYRMEIDIMEESFHLAMTYYQQNIFLQSSGHSDSQY